MPKIEIEIPENVFKALEIVAHEAGESIEAVAAGSIRGEIELFITDPTAWVEARLQKLTEEVERLLNDSPV